MLYELCSQPVGDTSASSQRNHSNLRGWAQPACNQQVHVSQQIQLRGGRVDNRLRGAAGLRWWDRAQWQVHIWALTICLENTASPQGRFTDLWETEEGIPCWEPSWERFMGCQHFLLQRANIFVCVSMGRSYIRLIFGFMRMKMSKYRIKWFSWDGNRCCLCACLCRMWPTTCDLWIVIFSRKSEYMNTVENGSNWISDNGKMWVSYWLPDSEKSVKKEWSSGAPWISQLLTAYLHSLVVKTLKKQMVACLFWSVVLHFEHFYSCRLKDFLFSSVC